MPLRRHQSPKRGEEMDKRQNMDVAGDHIQTRIRTGVKMLKSLRRQLEAGWVKGEVGEGEEAGVSQVR